jgi:hypothetical protein
MRNGLVSVRAMVAVMLLAVPAAAFPAQAARAKSVTGEVVLDDATYRDKVLANWLGQIVAVMMGLEFEGRPASVEWVDRYGRDWPHAPVDDDWYYEMKALEAFETHGPGLTVEQLGDKWRTDRVGFAGSSAHARAALERGILAPASGHPRYNRAWFTMGNQCRGDLYGLLAPGLPNLAARLSRRLGEVNSYAEGTEGGVLLSTMVSLAFVRSDHRAILREALSVLDPRSPQRQAVLEVVERAERGQSPEEISEALTTRLRTRYPVFNGAVLNMAMSALGLWFGEGDFLKTVNVVYAGGDFSDADCNAAVAGSVVATMCGTRGLPPALVAGVRDRIRGDKYNQHPLSFPVDETVTHLAERTVAMGRRVLEAAGVRASARGFRLPPATIETQPAVLFQPGYLTQYWAPGWELRQAAYTSVHGGTFLETDEVLATFPADESMGACLRRTLTPATGAALRVQVAADPGREWRLEVWAGNTRLLQREVKGGPAGGERAWQDVEADLSARAGRETVLRLYQRVGPAAPGNAYWRGLRVE